MMHLCQNCPGAEALSENLKKEHSDFDADEEFHYSQWQTVYR